ncbi:MAG: ergothioneine biosynthesis protein EgtB [Betaproteobacteria bacterium]|nr:ergothioneine biosynthesis protein EgtB [Betaproteobacteria bacterium]
MEPAALIGELRAAREHTRAVADGLGGAREYGPLLAIVNPPRWELGHVGWFQEYWCLRRSAPGLYAPERSDSILPNADGIYNSATVPHDTRWTLPLPAFDDTLRYRDAVLARVMDGLATRCDPDDAYFAQLAVRHEDMHSEAFHYTRQTLGYEAPKLAARTHPAGERVTGDAEIAGGAFPLGALAGDEFVFDNEKWSHPVVVPPFRMARTAVSNGEFAAFVEADGHRRAEFWSGEGWSWVQDSGRTGPVYWKKIDGEWHLRRFDEWLRLPPDEPVVHVCWHEASAYCRFARRRLPSELEWEFAALWNPASDRKQRYPWGDEPWSAERANLEDASPASVHAYPRGDSPAGVRQMIGNAWEWTSTPFLPYPGYLRDPYKEYSEPWFGTHKVLRGGAFATSARIGRGTYRNFFTADRADVFAGFRTCALERE